MTVIIIIQIHWKTQRRLIPIRKLLLLMLIYQFQQSLIALIIFLVLNFFLFLLFNLLLHLYQFLHLLHQQIINVTVLLILYLKVILLRFHHFLFLLLLLQNPIKHLSLVVQLFLHFYLNRRNKRLMLMNIILWRLKCFWSDFTLIRVMLSAKYTESSGINCKKIEKRSLIF